MHYRIWWRLLGDIAYAMYWADRERELPYKGVDESGVFDIKTHAFVPSVDRRFR